MSGDNIHIGDTITQIGGKENIGKIYVRESVEKFKDQGASDLDIQVLAQELAKLRSQLRKDATDPAQDLVLAQVTKAFLAAEKGDSAGAMKNLAGLRSQTGHLRKWVIDTATAIGIPMAVAALRLALHLPPAG